MFVGFYGRSSRQLRRLRPFLARRKRKQGFPLTSLVGVAGAVRDRAARHRDARRGPSRTRGRGPSLPVVLMQWRGVLEHLGSNVAAQLEDGYFIRRASCARDFTPSLRNALCR